MSHANDEYDIAVAGTGVMGGNLARNLASRGHRVVGYDHDPARAQALADAHPDAHLGVANTWAEAVAKLRRPRRLLLMVPAGAPVDQSLDALDPLLETDDVVIDGGNSLYTDTDRRAARAEPRPWRFLGMGVSGGAEGARLGPSLMPGGDPKAFATLSPMLEAIAAQSEHGACVTYCGRKSAGHFVKMVHNGIEYGDMQLIAETATLLRRGLGQSPADVSATFAEWNRGALDSYLVAITAAIFRTPDPKREGAALVDAILDQAGQKGTGRWTVKAALDLGVAIPTIAAAVDARVLSAGKAQRQRAEAAFGRDPASIPTLAVSTDDLSDALYAAKIASYAQGFTMMAEASKAWDYGIDLAEVARIWTGGCIIRAAFLGRISQAFKAEPVPESLALAADFTGELGRRIPALRRVVAAGTGAGIPVPGLAASLGWFDTLTTARGSANVIQAQRDYFGRHTYRRLDAPEEAISTDWPDHDDA
ncbi:MAG: NADP-dependent phosphogluconate dehydrogenase [Myxococcota bacterium]